MSSLFRAPAVGAVLALLFVTPLASAGPIVWSFTAKVEGADGGIYAHFGIETKDWFIQSPVPGEPSQEGQTDYQILANIASSLSGQMTGSAVGTDLLHLSSVGPGALYPFSMDT